MVQEGTRNYLGQDEIRKYCLTQDQTDLVEKYLEDLVKDKRAIQPRQDDPLYFIFARVHGGGLLVELNYEKGILAMAGDSSSTGNIVSYIESARLGRLKAESIFKGGGVQSQ